MNEIDQAADTLRSPKRPPFPDNRRSQLSLDPISRQSRYPRSDRGHPTDRRWPVELDGGHAHLTVIRRTNIRTIGMTISILADTQRAKACAIL